MAELHRRLGDGTDRMLLFVAAAALVVYLIVLFFSSFFTYSDGIKGFYEAYTIWTKTGSKDHTQNGTWAYLRWGMKLEARYSFSRPWVRSWRL